MESQSITTLIVRTSPGGQERISADDIIVIKIKTLLSCDSESPESEAVSPDDVSEVTPESF